MTTRAKGRAEAHDVQQILAAQMTLVREQADQIRNLHLRLKAVEHALEATTGTPGELHPARATDPHLGRF
jgi:hypothetical protein